MSNVSRDYQVRVTGFAPFTEWKFMNIEFDGFKSSECRLQEAKARYDQFFDTKTGFPKYFFQIFGVQRMLNQARIQSAITKNNPPARLTWYFMQPISHKYFSDIFLREDLPIDSLLQP
ncbi:restriction endonuclease fold toxin 5 domain-containing protein [Trinickia diaoshuihuensis]|uniref:restriction endonuclease fold toxin 5 domain-containing protein n=1 Tax=Trinickia diaoshuihuensis TaxID=2292265 RepID=UPI000E21E374|nr:restriction endonuclease fold toxin 5 domain-containing protein [Trinickia diaoshuihuensis]